MTASPTGPHPMTIAVSRLAISLRRTACSATAMGSVSAAMSIDSPLGTGNVIEASTRTCSAYPPGAKGESPVSWTHRANAPSGKTPPGYRS